MIPYVCKFVPPEDVRNLERMRKAILSLPDLDYGTNENGEKILLSCHMLARAASKAFNIKFVDGFFCELYEHSWLITSNDNIIDVYPVGVVGGPILVHGADFSPLARQYKERPLPKRVIESLQSDKVEKIINQIERHLRYCY